MSAIQSDDLLKLRRAVPFKPFRVHTTTGESFDVLNIMNILVGETFVSLTARSNPTDYYGDYPVLFHYDQIQRVEPLEHAPSAPTPLCGESAHLACSGPGEHHKQGERKMAAIQPDDLRKLRRAVPFKPFRVYTTTEEAFDVIEPINVLIDDSFVTLPFRSDPNDLYGDFGVRFYYDQILRIEPLESSKVLAGDLK